MRDYDAHLKAQYGPDLDGEDESAMTERDLYYCDDHWCDGHALPNQTCEEVDDADEGDAGED